MNEDKKFYEKNLKSKNMIMYDRKKGKNKLVNGLTFGKPGDGAGFFTKGVISTEIKDAHNNTIVTDSENDCGED